MRNKYTLRIVNSPRGTIYHILDEDREILFFGMFEHITKAVLAEINHPMNKNKEYTKHDLMKIATRHILKEKLR